MPLVGDTFTVDMDDPEQVRTPGVNWGRPLKILFRTSMSDRAGVRLVLRREGHSSYAGRFSLRDYSPTIYMLVELGKEKVSARHSANGRPFTRTFARVVEEVEPGSAWRPVVAKLIARAKE